MIFMTQKQFDRKVDMIVQDRDREERIWRRMEDLDRQISDIRLAAADMVASAITARTMIKVDHASGR